MLTIETKTTEEQIMCNIGRMQLGRKCIFVILQKLKLFCAWVSFNVCLFLFCFCFCFVFCFPQNMNHRLINAYLFLRVNLDKIMHVRRDFDDASSA